MSACGFKVRFNLMIYYGEIIYQYLYFNYITSIINIIYQTSYEFIQFF